VAPGPRAVVSSELVEPLPRSHAVSVPAPTAATSPPSVMPLAAS